MLATLLTSRLVRNSNFSYHVKTWVNFFCIFTCGWADIKKCDPIISLSQMFLCEKCKVSWNKQAGIVCFLLFFVLLLFFFSFCTGLQGDIYTNGTLGPMQLEVKNYWALQQGKNFLPISLKQSPLNVQVEISGAFTPQRKIGADPTKTGTVPIVFAKKKWTFICFVSDP